MIVELQFIEPNGDLINDKPKVYKDVFVPIPHKNEIVYVEGKTYIVQEVQYMYLTENVGLDMKALIICKDKFKD